MKRLRILVVALVMLFAIGPPTLSATPTNTMTANIAEQIINAPTPLATLGGVTISTDSASSWAVTMVLNESSGVTTTQNLFTKSIATQKLGHEILNEPTSTTKMGFNQTTAVHLQKTAWGLERSPPNIGLILTI